MLLMLAFIRSYYNDDDDDNDDNDDDDDDDGDDDDDDEEDDDDDEEKTLCYSFHFISLLHVIANVSALVEELLWILQQQPVYMASLSEILRKNSVEAEMVMEREVNG